MTIRIFSLTGEIKTWSPQSVNSRVLTIHNKHKWPFLRIIPLAEPTVSADDTSAIISSRSVDYFCTVSNSVLSYIDT
jgi:hypothetical protein